MRSDNQSQPVTERARFSRVRSVSQVELTFYSQDLTSAFQAIQKEALRWLAKRAGRPLPNHAWSGASFEMLEVGAQPVSALSLESPRYWCFRLIDADKQVAQRNWTTEAGILLCDDKILFGCRLQCVALGESPQFNATTPGVVTQMVRNHEAYLDRHRVSLKAWRVSSATDVDSLVELLLDSGRTRPVIVVSLGGMDGLDHSGAINADELARLTVGAAHVVALTGSGAYELTGRVGKEFSVFHEAVRTYRPKFDINEDPPTAHPIALPNTIADWEDVGAPEFLRFLVERALRDTVSGVDIYRQLPSFADVHTRVAKQKRAKASQEGASDSELLDLALEENESLQNSLKEEKSTYDGLLQSAEKERARAEMERDEVRASQRALQSRVMHLEAALRTAGQHDVTPIPDTFDGLEVWCANEIAGSVNVLPRAFRAASKSGFEDPGLAYKALLILRDHFVPMKRGGGMERKRAYEAALAELGLEDCPCFSGPRSGEQGDEYRVPYNGRTRHLERHLKGSSSREERFGFRLYFFWDDDTQQAVVGSFPAHLTTRAT